MTIINIKKKVNFFLRKKLQFFVKRANFFFSNSSIPLEKGVSLDKKLVVGARQHVRNMSNLTGSNFEKRNLHFMGRTNFSKFFSLLSGNVPNVPTFRSIFLTDRNPQKLYEVEKFSFGVGDEPKRETILRWSTLLTLRNYLSAAAIKTPILYAQHHNPSISNYSFKKFELKYYLLKYNFTFFSLAPYKTFFSIGFIFYQLLKTGLCFFSILVTVTLFICVFFIFVDGNFTDLMFLYNTFNFLLDSKFLLFDTYIPFLDFFWALQEKNFPNFRWLDSYDTSDFALIVDFLNQQLYLDFYNLPFSGAPIFFEKIARQIFFFSNFIEGFILSWLFFREHYFNSPSIGYLLAFIFFLSLYFFLLFFLYWLSLWISRYSDIWKLGLLWLYSENSAKKIWKPEAAANLFKHDLQRYLKFKKSFTALTPYNVQDAYTNFLLYKVYGGYAGYLNLFPAYDDFFSYSTSKINNMRTRNFRTLLGIRRNSIDFLKLFGKRFSTKLDVRWIYYGSWDIFLNGFKDFVLKLSNKKEKIAKSHLNLDNEIKPNIFTRGRFFLGKRGGTLLRVIDFFGLSNWLVQMTPVTHYRNLVLNRVYEDQGIVDEWASFDLYEKRKDAASRYTKEANLIILSKTLGLTTLRPDSFWKFKIGRYPFINRHTFWRLENNYLGEVEHMYPILYAKDEEMSEPYSEFSKKSFFSATPESSETQPEEDEDEEDYTGEDKLFFEDGFLHHDFLLAEEVEEDDDEELEDPEAANDTDGIEFGTMQVNIEDTRDESFDDLYYLWLASPGFIRGAGPEDDFRDVEQQSPEFFFRLARWHNLKTNYTRSLRDNLLAENPYLAVEVNKEGVEFSSLLGTVENHMDAIYDDLVDLFWLNNSNNNYWNFFEYPNERFFKKFNRTPIYLSVLRSSISKRARFRFSRRRRRRAYARKRFAGKFFSTFFPFFSEFLIPRYDFFLYNIMYFVSSIFFLTLLFVPASSMLFFYYSDWPVIFSFLIFFCTFTLLFLILFVFFFYLTSRNHLLELLLLQPIKTAFLESSFLPLLIIFLNTNFINFFKLDATLFCLTKPVLPIKLTPAHNNPFSIFNLIYCIKEPGLQHNFKTFYFNARNSPYLISKDTTFFNILQSRFAYANALNFSLYGEASLSSNKYNYAFLDSYISPLRVLRNYYYPRNLSQTFLCLYFSDPDSGLRFFGKRNIPFDADMLLSLDWAFKDLDCFNNFSIFADNFSADLNLSKALRGSTHVLGRFLFNDLCRIKYKHNSIQLSDYNSRTLPFNFSLKSQNKYKTIGGGVDSSQEIFRINYSNVSWVTNKISLSHNLLSNENQERSLKLDNFASGDPAVADINVEKTPWYVDLSSYNYRTSSARNYNNNEAWSFSGIYGADTHNTKRSGGLITNHLFRVFFSNTNITETYNRKASPVRLFKPENLFYSLFWGNKTSSANIGLSHNRYSTTSGNFSLQKKGKIVPKI